MGLIGGREVGLRQMGLIGGRKVDLIGGLGWFVATTLRMSQVGGGERVSLRE